MNSGKYLPAGQKLISYRDNAFQLVRGSNNADVRAELVWVGKGTYDEILQKDVQDKIAVAHGNVSRLHTYAIREGADGIIAISDSRNYFDPLQIPEGYIRPVQDTETTEKVYGNFAFQMNIREGQYLRDRLLRGEKIEVHAQVETSYEPYELQNVEAYIPGEDLSDNYKKAVWLIEAHILNEKATLEFVRELVSEPEQISSHLAAMTITIESIGEAHLSALESQMQMKASILETSPVNLRLSSIEEKAG